VLHYFDDVSEAIPSADNEEKYYDTSDDRIGMKQTTSDKQLWVRHVNGRAAHRIYDRSTH
jgi:hypothetical protein